MEIHGDVLPRSILEKGFTMNNQVITLVGAKGIWKPKVFEIIPLTITTVAGGPYDDAFSKDGFLVYRYRGTNKEHPDNVGLREAMYNQTPLIYFHGIARSKYLAVWPVFVIGDSPELLSFKIAVDEPLSLDTYFNKSLSGGILGISEDSTYYRRNYITSTIKARLHQKSFRERVLDAYNQQCAFCRLKRAELLDAAHIIPDTEEFGEPLVRNGLSLCKIHHATFDSNLIGVTPDYRIEVRKDLLQENDGPMLLHGIQELHKKTIVLPKYKELWPDRERLEMRFNKFVKAG